MTEGHDSQSSRHASGTRPAAGLRRVQLLAFLLPATAALNPQAATAKAQSTSATVQIRLSVAPRMELLAIDRSDRTAASAPGGGYCLSTNAADAALPLSLTWPGVEPAESPDEQERRTALPRRHELSRCGEEAASGNSTGMANGRPGPVLALIYPE